MLGNLSKPTRRWIGVCVWYWLASHPWRQERPCFHRHVVLLITAWVCSLRLYAAMPWSSVFNFSDYWPTESCPCLLGSTRKWSDLDTSKRRFKRSLVVKYGWIESRWEVCCSASREKFKMLPQLLSLLIRCMVKRAMDIFAIFCLAFTSFIYIRMVFTLFPSMTILAHKPIFAPILVISTLLLITVPVRTLYIRVRILVGLSSIILPIMCKDTNITSMVIFIVGAPSSLEVEHVKVCISFVFIDQIYRNFGFTVSKGTVVTVFTYFCFICVASAKFSFVFLWMVKYLNEIVRIGTSFSLGTRFFLDNILTLLGSVST